MRIALDYDDMYTRDPILWTAFVNNAKERGHSVTFVTFRKNSIPSGWETNPNADIEEDAKLLNIDIVYCNYKQKASQFVADVWIDDSPQYIPTGQTLKRHCENYDVGELKLADKK